MNNLRQCFSKTILRNITTSSPLKQPQSLIKMKKIQADFQCEDGRPIYLKNGVCDRILYSSTLVACFAGVIMVLTTIYDHAKPPSWKTNTC